MVILMSLRNILKSIRIGVYVLVLAIMIFYVLPKLLALFWENNVNRPKFRDEMLLEKPLRVEIYEKQKIPNKKKDNSTGNEREIFVSCGIRKTMFGSIAG